MLEGLNQLLHYAEAVKDQFDRLNQLTADIEQKEQLAQLAEIRLAFATQLLSLQQAAETLLQEKIRLAADVQTLRNTVDTQDQTIVQQQRQLEQLSRYAVFQFPTGDVALIDRLQPIHQNFIQQPYLCVKCQQKGELNYLLPTSENQPFLML